MKTKLLFIACLLFFSFSQVHSQNVHVSVGFQTFYDELEPYGTWVNYPQHGYVWRYRASGEFRPYSTNGRWVYTDDGWTWVSDYNWGWAPFHYGRWLYDDELGWLWVPGNEWAPAWVTWGSYNDNFAWAPIAPGISISIGSSYRPPSNYWVVCPGNYFGRPDWQSHAIRNNDRVTIINKVTIINNYNRPQAGRNTGYYRGPDTKQVERYTKAPVQRVKIAEASRPGSNSVQNNSVAFYRPNVRDDRKNTAKPPAPRKPADAVQLKRENPQNGRPANQRPNVPNEKMNAIPVQPQQHQRNPGDLKQPLEPGKMSMKPDPKPVVRPVEKKPEPVKNIPQQPPRQRPTVPPGNPVEPRKETPQQPRPTRPVTQRPPTEQRPVDRPQQQPKPVPVVPPNNRPVERTQQPRQERPVQPPQNRPVQPRQERPVQPPQNRPVVTPRPQQNQPVSPKQQPQPQPQNPVKHPPHGDHP